jgi:hypothetical protein
MWNKKNMSDMCLTCDWHLAGMWLKCERWLTCGWHALTCGLHVAYMWLTCGWHVADMWLTCGWHGADMWLTCGWHVADFAKWPEWVCETVSEKVTTREAIASKNIKRSLKNIMQCIWWSPKYNVYWWFSLHLSNYVCIAINVAPHVFVTGLTLYSYWSAYWVFFQIYCSVLS